MSAATRLGLATSGFRGCTANRRMAIATEGFICAETTPHQFPAVERRIDRTHEKMLREDDEILAVIAAFMEIL